MPGVAGGGGSADSGCQLVRFCGDQRACGGGGGSGGAAPGGGLERAAAAPACPLGQDGRSAAGAGGAGWGAAGGGGLPGFGGGGLLHPPRAGAVCRSAGG